MATRLLLVGLVLFLVIVWDHCGQAWGACEPGDQSETTDGTPCCSSCGPGFGVASPCSHGNDTACEPCADGVTFSGTESNSDACKACASCGKHGEIVQACNATADTVCQCEVEYFWDVEKGSCELCDLCPAGWGAQVACQGSQNTACMKCPNGTYSDQLSAAAACTPCSVCTLQQRMLQVCSSTQDTICLSIHIYKYSDGQPASPLPDSGHVPGRAGLPPVQARRPDTPQGKEIDIIPLYCAILGAVVIGLLAYVILVHYRRLKEKRVVRETHEDVEYSKASGGDSGICVEVDHHHHHGGGGGGGGGGNKHKGTNCELYCLETRVRDLPASKKKELERTFIISGVETSDWRGLARELGYNSRKISTLETRASRDSSSPLRHLLGDWGKRDNSTVGVLVRALRSIERQDVVSVLTSGSAELQPLTSTHAHV